MKFSKVSVAISTAAAVALFGISLNAPTVHAAERCADALPYAAATMPVIDRWSAALGALNDGPMQDAPMSEWLELYDASNEALAVVEPLTPPAVLVSTDEALLASFTTGREMSEAVINDDVFAGLAYGDDLEANTALMSAATAEFTAACTDLETI